MKQILLLAMVVSICHSFAHTKDDCIAIKSGGTYPVDHPTDNILFKDIQVVGGSMPFSVFHGYDKEKNVSGVRIENLTYLGAKLTDTDSARIRQQNTENLTIK